MSTTTEATPTTVMTEQQLRQENTTGMGEHEVRSGFTTHAVYVYQWPVRIWHWLNALSVFVLIISGYFIGSPLPTVSGEAYNTFLMGYIRFAHFTAGLIMAVGFAVRIYIAFTGNHHAKEMFTIPLSRKAFWNEVKFMFKWYTFQVPHPHRYVGHNPLSRIAMVLFAILSVFMICSGLALYGEGTLPGSWANTLFTSWMIPLFGNNSQNLHTYHHLGMWFAVTFITIHVYAAIREDILGRQSIVSTMISGYRFFREPKVSPRGEKGLF